VGRINRTSRRPRSSALRPRPKWPQSERRVRRLMLPLAHQNCRTYNISPRVKSDSPHTIPPVPCRHQAEEKSGAQGTCMHQVFFCQERKRPAVSAGRRFGGGGAPHAVVSFMRTPSPRRRILCRRAAPANFALDKITLGSCRHLVGPTFLDLVPAGHQGWYGVGLTFGLNPWTRAR